MSNFDLSNFAQFTSPDGQQAIVRAVRSFRENYGEHWREQLKLDFPDLFFIADLCTNHDAETAFDKLRASVIERVSGFWQRQITGLALDGYKPSLLNLHGVIRAEIKSPSKSDGAAPAQAG